MQTAASGPPIPGYGGRRMRRTKIIASTKARIDFSPPGKSEELKSGSGKKLGA
jgi:hypothetical protein